MTLLALQTVLSRALTDESFRELFFTNPSAACAGYELSQPEVASLIGLDRRRLSIHATLLQHGRVELALQAFPVSARLLHRQLPALIPRFCRAYPPLPTAGPPLFIEAMRLAEFIFSHGHTGLPAPEYLTEVMLYEQTIFWLGNSQPSWDSRQRHLQLRERPDADGLDRLIPSLGQHCQLLTFSIQMIELMAVLEVGEVPATAPRGPLCLLFTKLADTNSVAVLRINELVRSMLLLCDGRRTVGEIFAELARRLALRNDEHCALLRVNGSAALWFLHEKGSLSLRVGEHPCAA